MSNLSTLSAGQARAKANDSRTFVQDYAQALLERIKARDDEIAAWVHLDEGGVRHEAARLDAVPHSERGPLFGVPVAVKDIFYTKNMPTQHGSARYQDHFPEVDAEIVGVLRNAGCLIMGKTVTTEFAFTMNGKLTKNPLNVLHTPGGSSSGSAAAVADYQVPIAIGTQTFGSIARPASFVGIYGYKPTWNVVSMGGSRTFAPSLDTIGFFTRTVDDQEMLADSLKIQDIRESSYNGLKGAKFAVCKPSAAVWSKASPDALKSIQLASELLEAEGATVQDLVLPTDFDKWQEWHLIIACKELETHLLAETSGPTGRTGIDRTIAGFLDIAKKTSLADYVEALDGYRRLMVLFDELASGYDGILTLSAPGEAPRGLEWTGDSSFCTLWTALHVPVINIPGFGGQNALPIGISLLTGRYRDRHLLRVAKDVGRLCEARGNWKSAVVV